MIRIGRQCGAYLGKILLVAFLLSLVFSPSLAIAAPSSPQSLTSPNGRTLFETHCAGCHPNGNNIIRRGKTLKLRALKRHHVDSVDAIATLVTQGKGLMSAYGETLTSEEIDAIAVYVWEQAQGNWTS
ncbi:MAG: c-type cytochrome [Merismopedia sp. SIO2A8]|nr:c-type cytochrome [Symploca sp. SIO2B6]NET48106.1 c-type cytochrome [Merismopedia sp. SIO2A8]